MAKSKEKHQARGLRKAGKSIKEIAKKLKVSPSSVSLWCWDIKLTKKQIESLERNSRDPFYGRRLEYSLTQQRKRIEKSQKLKSQGIKEIGRLTKRELFLTGSALYWAEGFKKDKQLGFANIDPLMIKFFLRWLKVCFGYKNEDLLPRVTLNISHEHRINEVQDYWVKVTGIPLEEFRKPFFQKSVWKKTYENPNDYYGVLRVKVRRSADFLRRVNGYIEGLRLQTK